ncbi:MAG: hypothetical protein HQK49_07080 [Oligoflexia bacterium]|nr:hypothetical protein [Oligoflexia bacterium]
MKRKEFELLLTGYIPELFSFAWAIIPDDLQAEQVVIDALLVVSLHERQLIDSCVYADNILSESKKKLIEHNYNQLKLSLYSYVYRIASKRHIQLAENFKNFSDNLDNKNPIYSNFYSLEMEERSILFLKEVFISSYEEIAKILEINVEILEKKINLAREKFNGIISNERVC